MVEDSQILELYRQGEKDSALNLIVRNYGKRLYWHIRQMVASADDTDDILQNSFIKIWRSLDSFRGESELYTWIYRIATNESITFLNKERSKNKFSLTSFENILARRLTVTNDFSGDEIQLALSTEVLKLPDKQKAIFSLRYYQQMDYKQIAEIVDSSPDAAKASYSVAYKKIESALKNKF